MGWNLTWQDPVALALLVGAILFARWLRKRVTPAGCEACAAKTASRRWWFVKAGPAVPKSEPPRPPTPPTRVGVEQMRLGRARVLTPPGTAARSPGSAPAATRARSSPRG